MFTAKLKDHFLLPRNLPAHTWEAISQLWPKSLGWGAFAITQLSPPTAGQLQVYRVANFLATAFLAIVSSGTNAYFLLNCFALLGKHQNSLTVLRMSLPCNIGRQKSRESHLTNLLPPQWSRTSCKRKRRDCIFSALWQSHCMMNLEEIEMFLRCSIGAPSLAWKTSSQDCALLSRDLFEGKKFTALVLNRARQASIKMYI